MSNCNIAVDDVGEQVFEDGFIALFEELRETAIVKI